MRIFHFFLILQIVISRFASAEVPQSVFQARGLEKSRCYKEMASLICNKACVVDLFPMSPGQLSLAVEKINKKDRMKMGHFFEIRFRVVNDDGSHVDIINLRKVTLKEINSKNKASNGFLSSVPCP